MTQVRFMYALLCFCVGECISCKYVDRDRVTKGYRYLLILDNECVALKLQMHILNMTVDACHHVWVTWTEQPTSGYRRPPKQEVGASLYIPQIIFLIALLFPRLGGEAGKL